MHAAAPVSALGLNVLNASPLGIAGVDPAMAQRFSKLMEQQPAVGASGADGGASGAAGAADWQWRSKLVDMGTQMNEGAVNFEQMREELFKIAGSRSDPLLTQFQLADFNMRLQEGMSKFHWSITLANGCVHCFGSLMKQHQG